MKRSNISRHAVRLIAALILILPALYAGRSFIIQAAKLSAVSGAIAFALCPLCRAFEKRFSPAPAAVISLFTAAAAVLIVLTAVFFPIYSSLGDIYGYLSELDSLLKSAGIPFSVRDALSSEILLDKLSSLASQMTSGTIRAVSAVADILVACAAAWYLLKGRARLTLYAELIIPVRYRSVFIRYAGEAAIETGLYLRGQAIISLCVGILASAGLFVIGVSSAIPLGMTAGVLNMIPYVGPFIACIPVGLMALRDGFIPALLSIGVMIAVQQIDGLFLSPRIVGSSTGFPPALIMITVFAAGAAWGIPGMLLALPGLILIRTCVRVFVELGQND